MQESTEGTSTAKSTAPTASKHPVPIAKPTLILHTVFFHETDRDAARELGNELYDLLSRPRDYPLGFGAGVPVFPATSADQVDTQAARHVVMVAVLGNAAFQYQRPQILIKLAEWAEALGAGHVLPLLVSKNWRAGEQELPGIPLLTELYPESNGRAATQDEIVLALARLLRPGNAKPVLFISHAKADLARTGNVAIQIHEHVSNNTTAQAFYDRAWLAPGDSLSAQLEEAIDGAMFVAVHSDSYSSRDWCQRELLLAKRKGLPTLTVEVIHRGDPRMSAYGGNGPSILWDGAPAKASSRAMVEWVRAQLFAQEAARIGAAAGLPDPKVMLRAPELLDLAVGSLRADRAQVVIYPDPELSVAEREILFLASPRLHLATPSTAYRFLGDFRGGVDTPLDGMQVTMSLSDSPDVDKDPGFTKHHLDDAVVYVARCLVSAGAAIAYGGDFRANGYTKLLSQLIAAYNQTGRAQAEFLHSYLAAHLKLEDFEVTTHHLLESSDEQAAAMLPPPGTQSAPPDALYFSDMRRVMCQQVDACLVMGGQSQPRIEKGGSGYGGLYPGVVEEAWRMLEAGKPLYVCGGFGGAAGVVADLLEGRDTPDALRDETWEKHAYFSENCNAINADPYRKKLGLPGSMRDLADAVRKAAAKTIGTSEDYVAWNGLTEWENKVLFRSRDPVTLAALVFKGLLSVHRKKNTGKLAIELVHGSVTHARDLDAISVPVCDYIPVGGAAGALDRALGGILSLGDRARQPLIAIESDQVGSDWLHLANLGSSLRDDELAAQAQRASGDAVSAARRFGFERLGVVLYGGTVTPDITEVVNAMLSQFRALADHTALVWFETDAERFEALKSLLGSDPDVHLTTRVAAVEPPASRQTPTLLMQVNLHGDQLETTILPPAGTAVAGTRRTTLSRQTLDDFSRGVGAKGRSTPELNELVSRGARLAKELLGEQADELLSKCIDAQILIIHNVQASKLPFEMLATKNAVSPASRSGLSRRLAIEGSRASALFARPPKAAPLHVLLIINPARDLDGAQEEGEAIEEVLKILKTQGHVDPTVLSGGDATKAAVKTALEQADVLHYCGHAFFDGPGADQSGLVLADGDFTLQDMVDVETLPRVAFFNACEAGRVRGSVAVSEAAAFAEFFLRSGVEAYVGTHWYVGDDAASEFAKAVYRGLAAAEPLSEAVRQARAELLESDYRDWANYILYGEGRFRLVAP